MRIYGFSLFFSLCILVTTGALVDAQTKPGKVLICHNPGNHNEKLLEIGADGVTDHGAHGDYLVVDQDGDGFTALESIANPGTFCTRPECDVLCEGPRDCNDAIAEINPSAPDAICDGVDSNCSGTADDEYIVTVTTCGTGVCSSNGALTCVSGAEIDTCNVAATDGEACGDTSVTDCSDPDTCLAGGCVTNHATAGFPCGDAGNECLLPSTCDGAGSCIDNGVQDDGTACEDGYAFTDPDTCTAGQCVSGPLVQVDLAEISSADDSRGFRIFGQTGEGQDWADDWAGYSVDIVGDMNGDGLDEVLLGAPHADPEGQVQRGLAHVVWGKRDGEAVDLNDVYNGDGGFSMWGRQGSYNLVEVLCTGDLQPPDCGDTKNVGYRNSGAYDEGPAGDALGFDVAAGGDVNADGVGDLIVSAPYAFEDGEMYRGKSYILFGGSQDTSFGVEDIGDDAFDGGFKIVGEVGADHNRIDPEGDDESKIKNGDLAGWAIDALRDVNGDGLSDLLVGAPNALRDDRGRIYVVYGQENGTGINLVDVADESNDSGFAISGRTDGGFLSSNNNWGTFMTAAGDFNRDGYGDALIHPIQFAHNGSFVVFGSEDYQNVDLMDFQNENVARIGHCAGTLDLENGKIKGCFVTGFPVTGGGDFNGDGYSDIVFGGVADKALGEESTDSMVEIYIVFGADSIPVNLLNRLHKQTTDAGGLRLFAEDLDALNFRVWKDEFSMGGDVNGDGYDDLILGGSAGAGKIYVVFGTESTDAINLDDISQGIGGFLINGEAGGDRAGWAVNSSGDINGDGLTDIVIGAFRKTDEGQNEAGAAYVLFGDNFTGAITHRGDAGDNTLVGTALGDAMVGGLGHDLFIGNGGPDVYYGGADDDTIRISDTSFHRIHGGVGLDTIELEGVGTQLSLIDSRGRIDGIERVDLGAAGSQSVQVSKLDVLNLSDHSNVLTVFGTNTFTAVQEAAGGDVVEASDNGWELVGSPNMDGREFTEYANGRAILLVETSVGTLLPPNITPQTFAVDENSAAFTSVGVVPATDPDGEIASFSITPADVFAIDSTTGELTVLDQAQVNFESTTSFDLTVEVVDDDGLSSFAVVTIYLNDVNEAPTFTLPFPSLTVEEGAPNDTLLGGIIASDPDAGDQLTFSIVEGNDQGIFLISQDPAGQIRVADGTFLDYEQQSSIVLMVEVADLNGLTDTESLTIEVLNVDVISSGSGAGTFSTMNRSLWSNEQAFQYTEPAPVFEGKDISGSWEGTIDLPNPLGDVDAMVSGQGEFIWSTQINVDLGEINASVYALPVNITYPDEVVPEQPFTLGSSFLGFLPSLSSFDGNTPGYSLALGGLARDVEVHLRVGNSEDPLIDETWGPHSMEKEVNGEVVDDPLVLEYAKLAETFDMVGLGDDGVDSFSMNTSVSVELFDGSKAPGLPGDNLFKKLKLLGLPSNRGEFTLDFTLLEIMIDYILWSIEIRGQFSAMHDFTLAVNGIDATLELEDGTVIGPFAVGTDFDLIIPEDADENGDGKVDYTITLAPNTQLTNITTWEDRVSKKYTRGYLDVESNLKENCPEEGCLVEKVTIGPLVEVEFGATNYTPEEYIFPLGGFNTKTITGTFDLAN